MGGLHIDVEEDFTSSAKGVFRPIPLDTILLRKSGHMFSYVSQKRFIFFSLLSHSYPATKGINPATSAYRSRALSRIRYKVGVAIPISASMYFRSFSSKYQRRTNRFCSSFIADRAFSTREILLCRYILSLPNRELVIVV